MQGKRLPNNKFPDNPGEYAFMDNMNEETLKAGGVPHWLIYTPNGQYGSLRTHKVVEHEDGTITVSPSILIKDSVDWGKTYIDRYHGYLEKGVWREC